MYMKKVTIIDSICGSGKTSWAIDFMNESVDKKFIYITPYLDEVERVIDGCSNRFFVQKGVTVDEETYALSELVQWIFRSQLRDGKEINLYIPSERMRRLLKKWLGM